MIKTIPELIGVLRVLNPGAKFDMGNKYESEYGAQLYSTLPADKLVLPKGLVARNRYAITQSGAGRSPDDGFGTITVKPLKRQEKEKGG